MVGLAWHCDHHGGDCDHLSGDCDHLSGDFDHLGGDCDHLVEEKMDDLFFFILLRLYDPSKTVYPSSWRHYLAMSSDWTSVLLTVYHVRVEVDINK